MIQQHSVKFDCSFFFLTDAATTDIYTLSLHDALPILSMINASVRFVQKSMPLLISPVAFSAGPYTLKALRLFSHVKSSDRKSTRLNSSHVRISYAVFCLKKKRQTRPVIIFLGTPSIPP